MGGPERDRLGRGGVGAMTYEFSSSAASFRDRKSPNLSDICVRRIALNRVYRAIGPTCVRHECCSVTEGGADLQKFLGSGDVGYYLPYRCAVRRAGPRGTRSLVLPLHCARVDGSESAHTGRNAGSSRGQTYPRAAGGARRRTLLGRSRKMAVQSLRLTLRVGQMVQNALTSILSLRTGEEAVSVSPRGKGWDEGDFPL